jgi:hypothetical protein
MVYILPYIDQAPIYNSWQFNTQSGYTNANNLALVANPFMIAAYRCPSSVVAKFMAGRNGNGTIIMNVSYTGIAGTAVGGPTAGVSYSHSAGICSDAGILYANSQVSLVQIPDGTSNTWMVGEQSNHLLDVNGARSTSGYTSGVANGAGDYGWTMGAGIQANGILSQWSDGRQYNCTSVLYQINQIGFTAGATGLQNDTGQNFPLSSCHVAGVNMLFADGTVHFATNSMAITTVSALCTRGGNENVSFDE